MQPAKISIKGDFIDSQIYRGRLYLWTINGTLCTYDWNKLVDSLYTDDKESLPYTFTFKDGHYLYKHSLTEIFKDEDFRDLLLHKMNIVSSKSHIISQNQLKKFLIQEQDVPGGELPTDTEIYNSNLYFINDNGLFQATAHRKTGNPVSSKPVKLWGCKLLSIKANRYPQLALSGGDEGLFELDLSEGAFRRGGEVSGRGEPRCRADDRAVQLELPQGDDEIHRHRLRPVPQAVRTSHLGAVPCLRQALSRAGDSS
jgi:hypothetical protein